MPQQYYSHWTHLLPLGRRMILHDLTWQPKRAAKKHCSVFSVICTFHTNTWSTLSQCLPKQWSYTTPSWLGCFKTEALTCNQRSNCLSYIHFTMKSLKNEITKLKIFLDRQWKTMSQMQLRILSHVILFGTVQRPQSFSSLQDTDVASSSTPLASLPNYCKRT